MLYVIYLKVMQCIGVLVLWLDQKQYKIVLYSVIQLPGNTFTLLYL